MAPPVERKNLESTKKLRAVMGKYYTELMSGAESGKKTAWCTSVGPAELLRALGFNVHFPENHGAMLGATRMAPDLIPLANARVELSTHNLIARTDVKGRFIFPTVPTKPALKKFRILARGRELLKEVDHNKINQEEPLIIHFDVLED